MGREASWLHLGVWWQVSGTVYQVKGSKASRLELSCAHQAAVALGSTCIGAWASINLGRISEPAGSGHSRA
jgi:hypothetical protein